MKRQTQTFSLALLAIVAVSAITAPLVAVHHDEPRAQSVTRLDDLEVTGTTDATGVVTARAGVRLTTPTTGPIFLSGSGVPAGTATIGSLYLRTDTAQLYQNTDGATAWSQVGGGGSTSPSIAFDYSESAVAARNLSTLGTIDWYTPPTANPMNFPTVAGDTPNSKLQGGYILDSLRWKPLGTTFSLGGTGATSSTASDDIKGTALSTSTQYGATLAFSSVPATGMGYRFRVPATTTSRVLRIITRVSGCSNNTGARQIAVKLRDAGTTSTSTPVHDAVWKITYNSSTADDELIVNVTLFPTGSFIGTCDLAILAIQLGTA